MAKGLAPDNCKRSAELLGGSLGATGAGAAAGAGSGIPNKSRILGVAFDAAGAAVPLSAEDEKGLANGLDAFCCSWNWLVRYICKLHILVPQLNVGNVIKVITFRVYLPSSLPSLPLLLLLAVVWVFHFD